MASADARAQLWLIADEFRAWVVRDLQALPTDERTLFRGDYLFVIDAVPAFLVVVTPEAVSSGRIENAQQIPSIRFDLGAPLSFDAKNVESVLSDGAVRVRVTTDANTLRRLLAGTLKAKVAYLNGLVKIAGDLPCFMRLVAVLKGRGVGPLKGPASDASEAAAPRLSR